MKLKGIIVGGTGSIGKKLVTVLNNEGIDIAAIGRDNKKMSNEIENSKLVIIPKVKHSFLIEAPDLVADNLLSFIN